MHTLKGKDEEAQELIKNLQVFEVVCSKIHKCYFASKVKIQLLLCANYQKCTLLKIIA